MEVIILLILAVLVANSFDLFAIRQPMLYNAQKPALENKIIECTIEKNVSSWVVHGLWFIKNI